jgi:hypothetical protein
VLSLLCTRDLELPGERLTRRDDEVAVAVGVVHIDGNADDDAGSRSGTDAHGGGNALLEGAGVAQIDQKTRTHRMDSATVYEEGCRCRR